MRLREIREARGISQSQAAFGLNISPTVYNRYEHGLREPSAAMMLVIADYFGVTVDELLGREPNPEMQKAPRTLEARIVSGGMDKLTQDERETILSVVRAMYQKDHPELFDAEKGDADET